jgi:hypothetical protein
VNIDPEERVTDPFNVTAPEAVSVVVLTLVKDACPEEFTEARVVPEAGSASELNLPCLALTLPVEAEVRSKIPFTLSIPKTVTYPFIQF